MLIPVSLKWNPQFLNNDHIPKYAKEGDSGMDICADISKEDERRLFIGEQTIIPTGIYVALPPNYEIVVRPRSGLAYKYGVTVTNAPGTVDEGYRGEIKVILSKPVLGELDEGDTDSFFEIGHGDRIAQIVIQEVDKINWSMVEELPKSDRGEGGFGSTGIEGGTSVQITNEIEQLVEALSRYGNETQMYHVELQDLGIREVATSLVNAVKQFILANKYLPKIVMLPELIYSGPNDVEFDFLEMCKFYISLNDTDSVDRESEVLQLNEVGIKLHPAALHFNDITVVFGEQEVRVHVMFRNDAHSKITVM